MIEINGKYYRIDMDALMAWVTKTPSSEKNINTVTTITYPVSDDNDIVEKEISENKSTLNETMNQIRYDFVKLLLTNIFTTFTTDMDTILSFSPETMSFGQKLAFNTLLAKNIITED